MNAEDGAGLGVDDVAGSGGVGADAADGRAIVAFGNEADVLTVGLGGDSEPGLRGEVANRRLGQAAERKAQEIELLRSGSEEEIALVARRIARPVQFGSRRAEGAADIMAGRKAISTKVARHGEQIGELGPHVAADARDRRAAGEIIGGKPVDDVLPKPGLS